MRISTFWYCLKQGFKNICRNTWFSLASIATVSACIFLFCLFFSIIVNIRYTVDNVETTVGITIFFDEDLSEQQILDIGSQISARSEVKEAVYISAEDAWNTVKSEYFEGKEYLADGFADDNPLAGSASYEVFLNDIKSQDNMVTWLKQIPGVRTVNYSSTVASGLSSFSKMIGILSLVIIGILLAVSMFLISNTISVAASFKKDENRIMRLIGATNYMIRAPFVVEGILIGLFGAAIPLVAMYYLYNYAVAYVADKFSILSEIFKFLPIEYIFPYMAAVAATLGLGIGFISSFNTIRKQLRV